MTNITPDNIHQIPPKALARRAGITIQYCFLQDVAGKRYPPIQAIARRLLRQGMPVQWIQRGCNFYTNCELSSRFRLILTPEITHKYS